MLRKSSRPITDIEMTNASTKLVASEIITIAEIKSRINNYSYSELTDSLHKLNNSKQLTIGLIHSVWQAISNTLDHHDGNADLKNLEEQCACLVTMAWDDEIAISESH